MALKDEIRMNQILRNKTVITPSQQFPTLLINDDDFLTFNELCDISRQETLDKLYALRELCNLDRPEYNIIKGIAYSEKIRPVLTLLFSRDATSRYVTETFEIPREYSDEEIEQEENKDANNPKRKIIAKRKPELVPAYSIDPDTLNRLLATQKTNSQIDTYLIKNQRELLELYKEYLDNKVFYGDFITCDSTGNVSISSKHEDYLAIGKIDSLIIPNNFGEINMHYSPSYLSSFNQTYSAQTERVTNANNEPVGSYLGERIFIHKTLLPENYRKAQK